jgi:hypothetical protein
MKSESVAGIKLECMAGFVGIRNRPADLNAECQLPVCPLLDLNDRDGRADLRPISGGSWPLNEPAAREGACG